ncbi:hypothetical protein [Pedobacter endophyticus]|uniref:Histidine kinase N-terminal 7TM region domain-containing protein n=1 Tax=Pedobacter endophyticus TaxID=2789740 RepID=A0A7S9Q0P4_9SPHI|nr:hypothetical protein [Pedobacter endophyticus]QPH41001.1 hypothetical protein IZT61_07010 [Pedobacter endophyticus]
MSSSQVFLSDALLWVEGLAAIIALFFYLKGAVKNFWGYFSCYLVLVFTCELLAKYGWNWIGFSKAHFYNYFVIPLQFLFFYWLYAFKSLKKRGLFVICSLLYLVSFIPSEFYFRENKIIFSFNYTFGSLILMILVVMEYYKQITSADIVNFDRNRMFYINLGVTLFYIGTLPFWTFYYQLLQYMQIWNIYFDYFLLSGIAMYVLFSISFIWGRPSS